ncbi:hypothetical protein OG21DRAFT_1521092 [Imleria badia]|nr:hypothetical protein OG21DRAFT_1521092 [Imleria badia]
MTTCSKFPALVLQRPPLFLHHYAHSQAGVFVPWSSSADGVSVRLWERLSVSITVRNKKTTKEWDVWATARYDEGRIQLWLSRSAKKDRIAVSLCRVLFGTVDLNDALLLTTILSEDLDVLKRRGYEVLKRQQCVNNSGLTCGAGPSSCSSIAPETPSLPSTNLTVQRPMTEMDLETTINHSGFLGGNATAPGSLIPSSRCHQCRDAFRVVTRSVASRAEHSGTPIAVLPPSPCKHIVNLHSPQGGTSGDASELHTFLALAHEIAHNLVARHDSEHAFWFSAVCEAHIKAFLQLLGPASA